MADDLTRWSKASEAPAELQALLKSARQDVPSKAELAGLEASLGSLLEPPPAPGAPTATGGSAGSLPAVAKLAVLVAVGGIVGTAAWSYSRGDAEPASTPTPDSQPSHQLTAPKPAALKSSAEPSPTRPAEPEASQAAPEASEAPSAQAQPVQERTAPKQAAKPSEASLLSQAQRALKSDPARALAITKQHKRLYPKGALNQEREVIAIEALSRLNEKGTAQQKADAFKEKYPESAHQKKIDTLGK